MLFLLPSTLHLLPPVCREEPQICVDAVFSISDSLLLQERTNKSADLKQFKLALFNY